MKIIPIKVERSETPRTTKIVEWRLTNVCNFKCSFCSEEYHDGSKPYLDYDVYRRNVDRLIDESPDKKVWFQITGGEPTLYPKLTQLLKHIKDRGGYTSMISNGTRTLRWWREFAEARVLDRLMITQHAEEVKDASHTIAVNEIMQAIPTTLVTVFVTAPPQVFDKALKEHLEIVEKCNTVSSLKPISYSGLLHTYSDEQLKIFEDNLYVRSPKFKLDTRKHAWWKGLPKYSSDILMTFEDGTSLQKPAQYFVEQRLTDFKGWECDIGKDLVVIEVDEVFRGMCRQGGPIGSVTEDWNWQKDSIVCGQQSCTCSLDVQEPKRRS